VEVPPWSSRTGSSPSVPRSPGANAYTEQFVLTVRIGLPQVTKLRPLGRPQRQEGQPGSHLDLVAAEIAARVTQ
jgi:hypothetical protein